MPSETVGTPFMVSMSVTVKKWVHMPKLILVVDDEEDIREIVSEYLQGLGYDVIEATDGEQALQHCEKHHFDLVITDIRMPKMNGLDLLDALKERDDFRPVVLMTGYDLSKPEVENLHHKADGYVLKPFNLEKMKQQVESLLKE